ncbi:sensor histidine kinase [Phenylobacterium sp.]|jgi:two-component sensor histidine kinase|uniref:sensor histidine kinase n=1 Tax=Phenylobacterium sp. TaxID=1871053 RepID=UPI0012201A92|nr:sensor histidine kinase [Phenylobacterium sp.]THD68610.1 MAG: sensor histidine kinase [Phenylobacterium sp.]
MTFAFAEPDTQLASREASHRFLNTLAALHGLLRNDFGGFADPAVHDAVGVFSSRIQAFATIHRTLGEDPSQSRIDAAAYLGRLCEELCAAHLAPQGVRCEFRSDSANLPRDVCQNLGLIVVELVTNAAKHAFEGRSGGRVSICLRRAGEGWICQVADNGGGLRGDRVGDGMERVRGLARAIGGALLIHSDAGGVIATVRLTEPDV